MNEDQNLTVKDPVAPVKQPEAVVDEVKQVTSDVENLIATSNPQFVAPAGMESFIKPVLVDNLSKATGVGAQDHPPTNVTGNLITLPDGFGTREDAIAAASGKATDGTSDAGRVYERQDLRSRVLRVLKPAA